VSSDRKILESPGNGCIGEDSIGRSGDSSRTTLSRAHAVSFSALLVLGYLGLVYLYYYQQQPDNDLACGVGMISLPVALLSYSALVKSGVTQDLEKISDGRIPGRFVGKWMTLSLSPVLLGFFVSVIFPDISQTRAGEALVRAFLLLSFFCGVTGLSTFLAVSLRRNMLQVTRKPRTEPTVDFGKKIGLWLSLTVIAILNLVLVVFLLFNIQTIFRGVLAIGLLAVSAIFPAVCGLMLMIWIARRQAFLYDLERQFRFLALKWMAVPLGLVVSSIAFLALGNLHLSSLAFIAFTFSLTFCMIGLAYLTLKRTHELIRLRRYGPRHPILAFSLMLAISYLMFVVLFDMVPRQTDFLTFFVGVGGIVAGSLIIAWAASLSMGKEFPLLGTKGILAVSLSGGWACEDARPSELVGAAICGIGLLLLGSYIIAWHL